jgi:hypothetical protein
MVLYAKDIVEWDFSVGVETSALEAAKVMNARRHGT